MLRRGLYLLALLAAIALALPGCTDTTGQVQAPLGQEFSLSIGQTAAITGERLKIEFQELVEDSRCARGVVCIWQGRVSCLVRIISDYSPTSLLLMQPGLTGQPNTQTFQNYRLAFRVEPYPEAGKEILPDEYHLLLTITR
ncbi:MAG: hypothetical protein PHU08_02875 [Dehalococcoidales bacterium]|nr:hypothetical protein [Dehalococcoidales bacterium]